VHGSSVFDELRKFYGTHFANLKTRDFYQMAGRAGRRGMDERGFVYTKVNPHQTSFQDVLKIINGKPKAMTFPISLFSVNLKRNSKRQRM